jgi:hypothetical protein
VSYLRTSEAAALLHVSPNTLRTWERRFGFPLPQRTKGGHRLYSHRDIEILRDSIIAGLSISSAVSRARDGVTSSSDALYSGFVSFDCDRADGALEASMAVRSIERSVTEVLLPGVDRIEATWGLDSARWAFAAEWASGWLRRANHQAPAGWRGSVLVGDATSGELDPDAAYARALELACLRAGLDVMSLSVHGARDVDAVVEQARPRVIVIAGERAGDDAVARWAYAARRSAGAVPIALYRRGEERTRLRTAGSTVLAADILAARDQIIALAVSRSHDDRVAQAGLGGPGQLLPSAV